MEAHVAVLLRVARLGLLPAHLQVHPVHPVPTAAAVSAVAAAVRAVVSAVVAIPVAAAAVLADLEAADDSCPSKV